MLTQKGILLWSKQAALIFQKYIPCQSMDIFKAVVFPPGGTILDLQNLAASIGCNLNAPALLSGNWTTVLLHGDKDNYIVINQKNVGNPAKDPTARDTFYRYFWTELGRAFAAIKDSSKNKLFDYKAPYTGNEIQALFTRLVIPDEIPKEKDPANICIAKTDLILKRMNNEQEMLPGVCLEESSWFWFQFLPFYIGCHVENEEFKASPSYPADTKKLVSNPAEWKNQLDDLHEILHMVLGFKKEESVSYEPFYMDVKSLAGYFAFLFADPYICCIRDAAESGRLMGEVMTSRGPTIKKVRARDFDHTGFKMFPAYRSVLSDIETMLEAQLSKEEFWDIDMEWMKDLGKNLLLLRLLKSFEAEK